MAVQNRAYPASAQLPGLLDHCGQARYVWNLAVEQQSWYWPGRGSAPSAAERYRQLAEARKAEPWLAAGSSSIQQQALRDFDRAMAAFFDPANPARKPDYRSRHQVQGFAIRDTRARRLCRRWGEVFVPKVGWVRFRWTRQLPKRPGISRVTCDRAGRWHVSFPAPQAAVIREPTGRAVGIDRGVRTALVTSDGQHYRAPRISDRRAARYLALQRKLSRQHKRSKGRERTRRQMALVAATVTDRRKDWAEKISTRLIRENDVIVVEKLNTPGMVRRPEPKPDPGQPGAFLPNRARSKAGLNRGSWPPAGACLASGCRTRRRPPASRSSSSTRDSPRSSAMRAATPSPRTARAKRSSGARSAATSITPTATLRSTSSPGDYSCSRPASESLRTPRGTGHHARVSLLS
jgi:putative transposase